MTIEEHTRRIALFDPCWYASRVYAPLDNAMWRAVWRIAA